MGWTEVAILAVFAAILLGALIVYAVRAERKLDKLIKGK